MKSRISPKSAKPFAFWSRWFSRPPKSAKPAVFGIGKSIKHKFRVFQVYRLQNLKNTAHFRATEFKAINWLPTKDRFDQHTCVSIMKFFKGTAPAYADEVFQPMGKPSHTKV